MSAGPADYPPVKRARHEGGYLPPGWIECPEMGEPLGLLVPMKAPMDTRHDGEIPSDRRFTPSMAVEMAKKLEWTNPVVQKKMKFSGVAMVIDLSKARSFYDPKQFERMGIQYYKVPCLGREGAPGPEDTNKFCYIVQSVYAAVAQSNQCILVHCTHGYNRTGFMLSSYWVRYHDAFPYMSVKFWIEQFASLRKPGIYKQEYVEALFERANEVMPTGYTAAPLPDWKPEDEEDEMGNEGKRAATEPHHNEDDEHAHEEVKHDDIWAFGERVHELEETQIRNELSAMIWGPHRPHTDPNRPDFPGSHPVSLDKENLERLREKSYMVTWKADGTRYLMLIAGNNTFLIDRKFDIARVPVRFLRYVEAKDRKLTGGLKFGTFHSMTLLDGEMVVDEDVVSGTVRRRFLIYDLMMLNGQSLLKAPFKQRYEMIDREIVNPRLAERELSERGKLKYKYDYNKEPFSVRKKGFYPLAESRKLVEKLIPQLTHESDGLIFQGADDIYVPGTFDDLLKWKFSHLNSVDLLLQIDSKNRIILNTIDKSGLVKVDKEIYFPNNEDPLYFNNKVVECTYDRDLGRFIFLRERIDKTAPNGKRVYDKVMKSIEDDINENFLLDYVEAALKERGEEAEASARPQPDAGGNGSSADAAAMYAQGQGQGGLGTAGRPQANEALDEATKARLAGFKFKFQEGKSMAPTAGKPS